MKYLLCCVLLIGATSFNREKEWTPLLDKNLSQWESYLSFRHANDYNGQPPKDASGNLVGPVGYNKDETKVFSVVEEKGEPVLRVSGEIYGCLYTKQEFENYHLRLKVKWGKNKFVPRLSKLKDSGIVYHSIGKSGVDYWRAWMLGQEFQIMEGHMGDYWNIAQAAIDIRAYLPEGKMNSIASTTQPFLPFGTGAPEGFCMRSENAESPNNEWTTIELICFGDKSLHIVNGKVVMVLQNSRYVVDGKATPLTRGKIQLQSEAAETFYKDIAIKSISSMPAAYSKYF
jgi:hypothetical protein